MRRRRASAPRSRPWGPDELALGGDERQRLAVVSLEDAAVDLAVAGGDDEGLEPLAICRLGATIDSRR